MKNKLQKLMGMAFALCMAVVMLCTGVADVQAAGYQKSFTKDITIKGGQCMITLDVKKDTNVTVTVSTTSKNKKLNVQAIFAGVNEGVNGSEYFVNLDSKHKKKSFEVNLTKGTRYLYVTNYASDSVKVKVKVSAKAGKVIKFIKKEMIEDVG